MTVLPLRSFRAAPDDLDAVTAEITAKLRAEKQIAVVDPARALVDKGSDTWLQADHLLFSGIEAFGELRYAEAVKALRASLELSQSTYREYADVQGPRRVRDTCVYLGLARLEQGEAEDAAAWFQRAARTDPSWRPDDKQFSPAARAAFSDAHEALSGPPMETSLERLGPMADRIGAEVVVTGGVNVARDGRATVQLVIADRRKGEATEQSVSVAGASRAEMLQAHDDAIPRLVARILDRPILTPEARASRVRYEAGVEFREMPGASLEAVAVTNRYRWRGTMSFAGIRAGITARAFGPAVVVAGVTFFPGQRQNGGRFSLAPSKPSLEVQTGLAASVYLMPTVQRHAWTFAAGPGAEGAYAIFVFRSTSSVAPIVPSWFGPAALLSVRRDLGHSAFLQARAGADYALLGHPPAPLTLRAQLTAGTTF